MRRTPSRPDRAGFTLVELLVVITIIAILFALTSAAVIKALQKGDEVRTRNEISQLAAAVQAFKTDFAASYIPDRFVLPPAADPTGESLQYVSALWPRISATYLGNTTASRTAWGVGGTGNQVYILQGHQTLVFFLGGARDATGIPIGFSNSPTDPLDTTSPNRKGPYFDSFPIGRLKTFNFGSASTTSPWNTVTAITANNTTYTSFIDIYGTMPYIYFSAKKATNDYNNLSTDQQFGCAPYLQSATRFVNPSGFQIISAGKNTTFNGGGTAWPGAGGTLSTADGYYNVANFYQTLLGIAPN
jgi:prepilin-type N-terminal cleavage/methylation domain-containing protein